MRVSRETPPIPSDDELSRALSVLDQPDADEAAVDAAFRTVVSMSAPPRPSSDFARRVLMAARRAPLADGRRPLAGRPADWLGMAALAVAAAALAWGALAAAGVAGAPAVVRVVGFFVRGALWVLAPLGTVLRLWGSTVTLATALAEALASPPVVTAVTATALVSGLSLIALIRLLSTEQESVPWQDRSSRV